MHRLDKPAGRTLPTFAAAIALTLTLATGARADGPANPGCNCPPAKTVHRAVTHHVWHRKTWDVWTQGQVRWGWNAEYDARYGDVPVHYPNPPYAVSRW
jgi:hypothetical protein